MSTPNRLQQHLEDLVRDDRDTFSKLFFESLKGSIDAFLIWRGDKNDLHDYTHDHRADLIGLREATDYYERHAEALRAIHYRHSVWKDRETRPRWLVSWKPDGHEQLRKIADRYADDCVRAFVSRALQKIQPVFDRLGNEGAGIGKTNGYINGAVWTGELYFCWNRKGVTEKSFRAKLQIKTNFSKFGKLFHQFPLTFHDLKIQHGGEIFSTVSRSELWAAFGVEEPRVEKKPRKIRRTK